MLGEFKPLQVPAVDNICFEILTYRIVHCSIYAKLARDHQMLGESHSINSSFSPVIQSLVQSPKTRAFGSSTTGH